MAGERSPASFHRILDGLATAIASWDETPKQVPKAVGEAAAGTIVGGATFAFGHWLGADGINLLLATAGAMGAIKSATRGGVFDRLERTIEKIVAEKTAVEPPPSLPKSPSGKRKPAARTKRKR